MQDINRKEKTMLQKDDTLKTYRRLRPTWKQMANAVDRIVVGSIGDGNNAIPFVADGFWLLTNAILPEGLIDEVNAKRGQWERSLQLGETHIKADEALGIHATSTEGVIPAEPIAMRTFRDKVSTHGKNDILILRTANRDIGVNPRKARWVERYNEDKGQWFVGEGKYEALRYVVDGKVAGLLMPFAHESRHSSNWRYDKWGIKWNKETRRYEEL